MNVSTSTSIPFLSWLCTTTLKRLDGSGFHTANPLDQKAFTSIALFGYEPNFASVFACTEKVGSGSLVVPQYVLSWLPANTAANGLLAVNDLVQSRFSASGLDAGYFNYQVGAARNVQYTAGPGLKVSPK